MRVLSEPLLGEDGDVVRAVQQSVHLNNGSSLTRFVKEIPTEKSYLGGGKSKYSNNLFNNWECGPIITVGQQDIRYSRTPSLISGRIIDI